MPRKRWVAIGAVAAVLACVATWLLWPASPQPFPGTVQAVVVPPEEASAAVGATLLSSFSQSEPPAELQATPEHCAIAVGPATRAVYGPGWSRYYAVTYQDSETVADHVVVQVVGTYPDSATAGEVFRRLTIGLGMCRSASRTDADQYTTRWVYTVESTAPDAVSWKAASDGGQGWACYRHVRLVADSVLQAAVCGVGAVSTAAAGIADQLATRVRE